MRGEAPAPRKDEVTVRLRTCRTWDDQGTMSTLSFRGALGGPVGATGRVTVLGGLCRSGRENGGVVSAHR
jgi:hypothetical protein